MQFNVNINYLIDGEEFGEVQAIVTQLTEKKSFAYGKATVVGINMSEVYKPSGVDAIGATHVGP